FGLCGHKGEAPCPEQEALVRQGDNIVKIGEFVGLVDGVTEAYGLAKGLFSVAKSGLGFARMLGDLGEASSGLVKNTARIPSLTGTAAYRIPDGLTATTLSEVKNVSSLGLSNQLRDFAGFAGQTGRSFDLYVRKTTQLSGPLQQFIKNNKITLRFLK
ncbi:MAG TPA: putative toxin, partial [Gemmatimonadaceae bacterium]|nr:putative toxin [Gemmatimonadaceae bacterium]